MTDINKLVFLVLERQESDYSLNLRPTMDKVKETGSEAWEGIKKTAHKAGEVAQQFHHDNPGAAGAVAGAVGGIGSYILGKKALRKYRESQYGR